MKLHNPNTCAVHLIDFCGPLISEHHGSTEEKVLQFSTIEAAEPQSLVFINHEKWIEPAATSQASLVLAPQQLKEKCLATNSDKLWLFSPNVDLAARQIKQKFVFPTPYQASWEGVHASAVVDSSAELGLGVVVGPNVVIGAHVRVGEGTYIGANTVIEENVVIQSHCTIHPQVYIGHSCEIGHNCEIQPMSVIGSEGFGYAHDQNFEHYRIPHTGKVILKDRVHVGAGVAIDRGTLGDSVIGENTKMDNHIHLAHNSVVGKNGLITAHMVMAGSSTIGDNFSCGGLTGITGHVKITDNVQLGGKTGVTKDINEPGQYGGFPAIPLRKWLKVNMSSQHLPDMRKQLKAIAKKVGLE